VLAKFENVFCVEDEHMETFLEMYRIHECLWNNKSENYHKTTAREKTYKTLHSELNLPQLSVNDIRGKIKTIRRQSWSQEGVGLLYQRTNFL
jgi:hypothetical protein